MFLFFKFMFLFFYPVSMYSVDFLLNSFVNLRNYLLILCRLGGPVLGAICTRCP